MNLTGDKSVSRKNKDKPKYLFDGTVYYHLLELDSDFGNLILNNLQENGRVYTLNIVLIELRLGLLRVFIEFYNLIKAHKDVSKVRTVLRMQNYAGREQNKISILTDTILPKKSKLIHVGDYRKYLLQLEEGIALTSVKIKNNATNIRGDFAKHQLLAFDLTDSSQYDDFIKECVACDNKLQFSEYYLATNVLFEILCRKIAKSDVSALSKSELEYKQKLEKKLNKVLVKPSHSLKHGTYSMMGDVVILLESIKLNMRGGIKIVSNDKSFRVFGKLGLTDIYDYNDELKLLLKRLALS